jgi:hypothetical protein
VTFEPKSLEELKDAALITQDDLDKLAQCTPFQRQLVLSQACVAKLQAERTIHFAGLKSMSADLVNGFKTQQKQTDADIALLYTNPCTKIAPLVWDNVSKG